MKKHTVIIYLIVLMLLAAGAIFYIQKNVAANFPAQAFDNIKSEKEIQANETNKSSLGFGASGKVVMVAVKAGENVTKGQVLAKIDDTGAQAQYAQAKSAVDASQADLAAFNNSLRKEKLRLKDLESTDKKIQKAQISYVENSIVSQEAKVQQALDNLVKAKNELDKYVIKAPFDGIITRQDLSLGEIANPNVPVIFAETK
jgi:multidrug resistance efflux pump